MVKFFSDSILGEADKLVAASKSLDYQKVVAHDVGETNKLKAVLAELRIAKKQVDESLESYANKQAVFTTGKGTGLDSHAIVELADANSVESEAAETISNNDQDIMAALNAEGLTERVGLIYSSFASSRTQSLSQAHHRRGIPAFEAVVAPDFAPVPGFHGVFISTTEVMSVILPSDDPTADWQVVKRQVYKGAEEMIEFVSLISAGFDLP